MAFLSKKSTYSILLILICAVVILALFATQQKTRAGTPEQIPQPEAPEVSPITFTFVGDMMLDRGVRRSVENNFENDYSALFANASYLKDTDITFGNLEGTVTEEFGPRTGSRFSFRMNPSVVPTLQTAGFDIVSFANNHVGDYGTKGFLKTLEVLDTNGLPYVGAGKNRVDATTPRIIEVRGTRIGFLGATDIGPEWLTATDVKPGILFANDPTLPEVISAAKSQVDVLVMSYHFGNEYSPANSRQEKIARMSVDAGADIVVGHHPHVMERVEEYNGKLIYYSLGNFIFDQYFSPHTMRGMVATVTYDPTTKVFTHSEQVSPLSKQFIPQPLVPFDTSMLIAKTFTP